jgi:hypothetical protein
MRRVWGEYEESIGKARERLGKGMGKVSDKYAKGIRQVCERYPLPGSAHFQEKRKDLTP